jgi:aminopeptidase N
MNHLISLYSVILSIVLQSYYPCFAQNVKKEIVPFQKSNEINQFDIHFYWLNLEVCDTSTFLSGNTCILASVTSETLNKISLDFSNTMQIDSISVNDRQEIYNQSKDKIDIRLNNDYRRNEKLKILIYYHGYVKGNGFFGGVSNQKDNLWKANVTWSLSEPNQAKNWFPCKEVLTDKADSAWVFITTSDKLKAGSNGLLEKIVKLPGNKIRYEWKTRYPIAFYLLSFSVSDYAEYNIYAHPENTDSLLIQNYYYNKPGYFEANKNNIDESKPLMELYCKLYGPYPFIKEKYGHCLAPLGGGMEHQTMTTLANFDFLLVAHEMSHQWFGDYVTCASYQDIWVNEGFASYSEYIALEYLKSNEEKEKWLQDTYSLALDEKSGSIFVPLNSLNDERRIFDYSLTYKKGAAIIHMIRHVIDNDSLFFSTLRNYLEKYKYSNASAENFKRIVENATGKNLKLFFDQWYYGQGYPIFDISWNQQGDSMLLISKQSTSSTSTPFFNVKMEYKLIFDKGDSVVEVEQDTKDQGYYFKVPQKIVSIVADPQLKLLKVINSISRIDTLAETSNYRIYPVPFSSQLNISFDFAGSNREISLLDMHGKTLYKTISRLGKVNIPTSGLSKGIYIVKFIKDNNIQSVKVVKTKE